MRRLGKFFVAVLYAAGFTLYGFFNDNAITPEEWVLITIATVTAVNTYVVPNTPEWPWLKTVTGVILVALGVVVNVIIDGITLREWLEVVLAAFGALGITFAPAISDNGQPSNP